MNISKIYNSTKTVRKTKKQEKDIMKKMGRSFKETKINFRIDIH